MIAHASHTARHTPSLNLPGGGVACDARQYLKIMALSTPGQLQSSLELLEKLDEQLKGCTPLEECPGEQGYKLYAWKQ